MAYKLYINNDNVSDFVIGLDSVPVLSINKDFSITSEGYSFELSSGSPVTPYDGDTIYFYSSSTLMHIGVINDFYFDDKSKSFNVDVKHIFETFKNFQITPDNFESTLNKYTESISISNYSQSVISHNNLIKAVFDRFGNYTLDWSFYTASAVTWYSFTGIAPSNQRTEYASGSTNDIYYIPNQILSVNQDEAFTPRYNESGSIIGSSSMDLTKCLTGFELLSALSCITGYTYISKSTSSFYVINDNTNYSIPDDFYYGGTSNSFPILNIPSITQKSLYFQVAINNGYWFPEGAPQQYFNSLEGAYNEGVRSLESNYTLSGSYDQVIINNVFYNQLNPILLGYWDGITKHPYVAVPLLANEYSPAYYLRRANYSTGVQYVKTIKASDIFKQGFKNVLKINITDFKRDFVEIEYIIYD